MVWIETIYSIYIYITGTTLASIFLSPTENNQFPVLNKSQDSLAFYLKIYTKLTRSHRKPILFIIVLADEAACTTLWSKESTDSKIIYVIQRASLY